MRKRGIDVLLIASDGQMHHRGYLRYLSYWRTPSWEDYMVFPLEGEPTFFTHYTLRARWANEIYGIKDSRSPSVGARHDTYVPYVVEELKKRKPHTIGLASSQTMSGEFYKDLVSGLGGYDLVEAGNIIDEVRAVKSAEELKLYRRSGEVADLAYRALLKALKPGRKEYEVVADAEHAAKSNGAEEVFYMIGSGSSPELKYNGMLDRTLRQGDLVVFTLEIAGPGGYWTEISRAVSIGSPSKSAIEAHKVVVEAEKKAVGELRTGNSVGNVGRAIVDNVKGKGYALMGQALGHGAGLDIYEPPLITPEDKTTLKPGMIFAIHPHALTSTGEGIIVCNNYLVTEGAPEPLFKSSSDLEVV